MSLTNLVYYILFLRNVSLFVPKKDPKKIKKQTLLNRKTARKMKRIFRSFFYFSLCWCFSPTNERKENKSMTQNLPFLKWNYLFVFFNSYCNSIITVLLTVFSKFTFTRHLPKFRELI